MSRLPLLISEKIQLSARQHNPNAFVGIIKSKMPFYPNIKILNLAYQQLISKRANLNIIFKRNEKTFYKQLHPIAFLGVRQFKDQTEIEHWQKKEFNVALGPLHELGIFPSKKIMDKTTCFIF